MALTPLDVHNKEFRRSFRGYSEEEVDDFLDEVVRTFESLLRENDKGKERIGELSSTVEHYRGIEETLNNTLLLAQQTAEEVKSSARKEAELIVREAEMRADELLKGAEASARRIAQEQAGLRRHVHAFRAKMRGLVQEHLELLDRQVEDADADLGGARPSPGVDEGVEL